MENDYELVTLRWGKWKFCIQYFDPCEMFACEEETFHCCQRSRQTDPSAPSSFIHFTRRELNNLDMTKWKTPHLMWFGLLWFPLHQLPRSSPNFIGKRREPAPVFHRLFVCLFLSTFQYRYAKLDQLSQFGGEPCNFHDREEEACDVPARFTCDNIPLCEGFVCTQTGTVSATPV